MSRPMTLDELRTLLDYIAQRHSRNAIDTGVRCVRKVEPVFDPALKDVYQVTLRGYGWQQTLHTLNESASLPECLLKRCILFLQQKPDGSTQPERLSPVVTAASEGGRIPPNHPLASRRMSRVDD